MKVDQVKPIFSPIMVTFETENEQDIFLDLLEMAGNVLRENHSRGKRGEAMLQMSIDLHNAVLNPQNPVLNPK